MCKGFYLLFSKTGKLQPKILKTMRGVNNNLQKQSEYIFQKFESLQEAEFVLQNKKLQYSIFSRHNNKRENQQSEQTQSENKLTEAEQQIFEQKTHGHQQQMEDRGKHSSIDYEERFEVVKSKIENPDLTLEYFTANKKLFAKMDPEKQFFGFFDGASKFNPGPSGAGYILNCQNRAILEGSHFLGKKTNNQAELLALLYLLIDSYCNGVKNLKVYGDSSFIIKMMNYEYKVRSLSLLDYAISTLNVAKLFQNLSLMYISRNFNLVADELANKAIKSHLKEQTKRKKEASSLIE